MSQWLIGWLALGGVVIVAAVITWIVVRSERRDTASAWDAQFAKPAKTGLWGRSDGIYLGLERDQPKRRARQKLHYAGDRHLMTLGPNGSGKTYRLLYQNLMHGLKDWSVVVIDPKGDLARDTEATRRKMGSEIIVLDPFAASGLPSDRFNPIAALDPDRDSFPDDAMFLAEAMIKPAGDDPHWGASAQDLVAALIMTERLAGGCDFGHLRALLGLDIASFSDKMRDIVGFGKDLKRPELSIKAGRFADLTEQSRELISIVSTALTQTRWLDSPPMRRELLGDGVIRDFGKLKETPTTIYIVLPPALIETHSVWMRLVVASILRPLLFATGTAVPVLLMMDEYPALARGDGFPGIARNMAMFRGYGIKLWSVWQDLNQARQIYGQFWETFAANAGALLAFQPQDNYTAQYLSERTGLTTRDTMNWSWSGKVPSFSGGQTGMPLMLPQALRDMGPGEALILSHVAKGPTRAFLPFPDLPNRPELAGNETGGESALMALPAPPPLLPPP